MRPLERKPRSRHATFSRRAVLLSGGMTAVFGVLAGRLYELQIAHGELYRDQAEENRVNERLLAPLRGRILDRFGVALAGNRRNYRVLIVPEQTRGGVAATLDSLAKVIPIDERMRTRVLKDAAAKRPFVPLVVAENLSWEDFARLNFDLPYLPGVQPEVGDTRDYPYPDEVAHVLGYVGPVSADDLASPDDTPVEEALPDVPGLRIGKRGIEKTYEVAMRGRTGASRVEVNAHGRIIRELERDPGTVGTDIHLTIDRDLQSLIHQKLKNDSASCVVMDVNTGDVLALVSTPGFDPNAFNVGLSPEEWNDLTNNDYKPLINKVVSGAYPPGSTFKMVVALAALDAGVITADTFFNCTGAFRLGTRDFHCWKLGGHGSMNLRLGIKNSCDCYFYQVALKLGIDAIQASAHRLGLGQTTGIEIPGERSGFIPDRYWKQAAFKEPWQLGETLVTSIGQGFVLATPLQLCVLAARIASGKQVSPRIVHSLGSQRLPRPEPEPIGFSARALRAVRDGMDAVTNDTGGTGYWWRILDKKYAMAGKTGTAQVRVITRQERVTGVRTNESLPWALRDHSLFIAYAPLDKPRYACSVVIEHGAVAAHPNVQVARDALLFAQERDILGRAPAYPVKSADASP
jgi:penicillin-binding protein 2